MGGLNTSFVKNGETAITVTYVTGTLVKLAQGIERHLAGGRIRDWLGYAVQYASFALGGFMGGLVGLVVDGAEARQACASSPGVRGPGNRSNSRAPPSGLAVNDAVPPCSSAC
jgi:hypothetical protein